MDGDPTPPLDPRALRAARRASGNGGAAPAGVPAQAPILAMPPPNANVLEGQGEQPHQYAAAAAAVAAAAAAQQAAQPAAQAIGLLGLPPPPPPAPLPAPLRAPPLLHALPAQLLAGPLQDPPGLPPAGPANPPSPPLDDEFAGITVAEATTMLDNLWATRHNAGTPQAPAPTAGPAPAPTAGPAPAPTAANPAIGQHAAPQAQLQYEAEARARAAPRFNLDMAFLPRRNQAPPLGYQEARARAAHEEEIQDGTPFYTARDLPDPPSPVGAAQHLSPFEQRNLAPAELGTAPAEQARPQLGLDEVGTSDAYAAMQIIGRLMQRGTPDAMHTIEQMMQVLHLFGLQAGGNPQRVEPVAGPTGRPSDPAQQRPPAAARAAPLQQRAGPTGEIPEWQGFASPVPQAGEMGEYPVRQPGQAAVGQGPNDREVARGHWTDIASDPDDPDDSSDGDGRHGRRPSSLRALPEPHQGRNLGPARAVPPAPEFTATEGALPNVLYIRQLLQWFTSNCANLEGRTHQQLCLLIASFSSPPAVAFFEQARPEFKWLCPSAASHLARVDTSNGVGNLFNFFATDSHSDVESVSTVYGQPGRSPMECFMAAASKQAKLLDEECFNDLGPNAFPSQEQEWSDHYGGKRFRDPIMAFYAIVERRLTKPGAPELQIWTKPGSMVMGGKNALDQKVPPSETPLAFGQRVVSTWQILTNKAPDAFRERAGAISPVTVFINGLPKDFPKKQTLIFKLSEIDTMRVNEFKRVGIIATMAQTFYGNSALAVTQSERPAQAPSPAADQSATPRRQGGWTRGTRRAAVAAGQPDSYQPTAAAVEIQPLGMKPTPQQMRPAYQQNQSSPAISAGGRGSGGRTGSARQDGHQGGRGSPQGGRPADQGRAQWQQGTGGQWQPNAGGQQQQQQQPRSQSPGPCRLCKDPSHGTGGCPQWEQASKDAEQRQRGQAHKREGQHPRAAAVSSPTYYACTTSAVMDSGWTWTLGSEDESDKLQVTACLAAPSSPPVSEPVPPQAPTCLLVESPASSDPSDSDTDGSDNESEQLVATLQALVAKAIGTRRSERQRARAAADPSYRGKTFPATFKAAKPAKRDKSSSFSPAPTPSRSLPSSASSNGGIGPRPASFNIAHMPPVPTDDEYAAQLAASNHLTYFSKPSGRLEHCLGLMVQGSGTVHVKERKLLDPGANVNIITEPTCLKLGIAILPTTMRLTTSTSQDNPVVGITPPIAFIYGVGSSNPLVTWHRCLVTRGMDELYQVLIGNLDLDRYGAVMDAGRQQLTMRPHFSLTGVNSPTIQLDLCQRGAQASSSLSSHSPARTALVARMVTEEVSPAPAAQAVSPNYSGQRMVGALGDGSETRSGSSQAAVSEQEAAAQAGDSIKLEDSPQPYGLEAAAAQPEAEIAIKQEPQEEETLEHFRDELEKSLMEHRSQDRSQAAVAAPSPVVRSAAVALAWEPAAPERSPSPQPQPQQHGRRLFSSRLRTFRSSRPDGSAVRRALGWQRASMGVTAVAEAEFDWYYQGRNNAPAAAGPAPIPAPDVDMDDAPLEAAAPGLAPHVAPADSETSFETSSDEYMDDGPAAQLQLPQAAALQPLVAAAQLQLPQEAELQPLVAALAAQQQLPQDAALQPLVAAAQLQLPQEAALQPLVAALAVQQQQPQAAALQPFVPAVQQQQPQAAALQILVAAPAMQQQQPQAAAPQFMAVPPAVQLPLPPGAVPQPFMAAPAVPFGPSHPPYWNPAQQQQFMPEGWYELQQAAVAFFQQNNIPVTPDMLRQGYLATQYPHGLWAGWNWVWLPASSKGPAQMAPSASLQLQAYGPFGCAFNQQMGRWVEEHQQPGQARPGIRWQMMTWKDLASQQGGAAQQPPQQGGAAPQPPPQGGAAQQPPPQGGAAPPQGGAAQQQPPPQGGAAQQQPPPQSGATSLQGEAAPQPLQQGSAAAQPQRQGSNAFLADSQRQPPSKKAGDFSIKMQKKPIRRDDKIPVPAAVAPAAAQRRPRQLGTHRAGDFPMSKHQRESTPGPGELLGYLHYKYIGLDVDHDQPDREHVYINTGLYPVIVYCEGSGGDEYAQFIIKGAMLQFLDTSVKTMVEWREHRYQAPSASRNRELFDSWLALPLNNRINWLLSSCLYIRERLEGQGLASNSVLLAKEDIITLARQVIKADEKWEANSWRFTSSEIQLLPDSRNADSNASCTRFYTKAIMNQCKDMQFMDSCKAWGFGCAPRPFFMGVLPPKDPILIRFARHMQHYVDQGYFLDFNWASFIRQLSEGSPPVQAATSSSEAGAAAGGSSPPRRGPPPR